jgi:hypothetical protein
MAKLVAHLLPVPRFSGSNLSPKINHHVLGCDWEQKSKNEVLKHPLYLRVVVTILQARELKKIQASSSPFIRCSKGKPQNIKSINNVTVTMFNKDRHLSKVKVLKKEKRNKV